MSSCANSADPLVLTLGNYTVSPESLITANGIQIGVGTPQQLIVFAFSTGDTYDDVFASSLCANSDISNICLGTSGGVFDNATSSTFTLATPGDWNGTSPQLNATEMFDSLSFATSTVYGYPLLLETQNFGASSSLSISANGTFLNATVKAGAAPSTDWGIWVGSNSVWNPQPGSLIIGGYDSNRRKDKSNTYTSRPNCSTCVQVVNMTYLATDGTVFPLFDSNNTGFVVSLDPYFFDLGVSQDVYDNFGPATNATSDQNLGWIWPTDSHPQGILSVTLSDGYYSHIPWTEFIDFQRGYDTGPYSIQNDSVVYSYLYSDTNNENVREHAANWGFPFLSSNYLFAQYDKGIFDLTPVVINDDPVSAVKVCSDSSPTPTSTPSPSSSPVPHHNSDVGVIAGAVVGGVIGLILITLAVWFFIFRHKREARPIQRPVSEALTDRSQYEKAETSVREGTDKQLLAMTGSIVDSSEMDAASSAVSSPNLTDAGGARLTTMHNLNGPLELAGDHTYNPHLHDD